MSGSLFMGQDGQWKLKSKQGLNFSVKVDIGPYTVVEPTTANLVPKGSTIRSCITDIILTAADGTQYTFGGTSSSIEFSRVGYIGTDQSARDGGTVPTSWYLTKIVSVTSDEIDLGYTRDGYQIMNYPGGTGYTYTCPSCTPSEYYQGGPAAAMMDQLSILDGVTLSGITGANGSIQFNKSKANILDYSILNPYNIAQYENNTIQTFSAYGYEVFNGTIQSGNELAGILNTRSTFMKLDQMVINGNDSTPQLTFSFGYTENTNNRLFLNSISQTGADGTTLPPYTFAYNNINGLSAVPYETSKVDHWGYYNGVDPLTGLTFYNGGAVVTYDPTAPVWLNTGTVYHASAFDNTFNAVYTSNRSPAAGPMQYGVLTQITYPTGGNTHFTWEPNTYSQCIDQTPVGNNLNIAVKDLGANNTGPGLRINQESSTPNSNSPAVVKSYLYDRDYKNNNYTSSGILNSAQPQYVDSYESSGNFTYHVWSTNNRVPLHYTNGSPITYTHVQELNSDGGYKVYTYSNHDNGYSDKIPNKFFVLDGGNMAFQELNTNSMELERGLLLNVATYKAGSILQSNRGYLYNTDPNRFSTAVRRYLLDNKFSLDGTILNFQADPGTNPANPGPPVYTGFNYYALNTYIHYPFLQSDSLTEYDQNGGNPLTTVTNYTYDNYRNKLSESMISSKGESLVHQLNYSGNTISGLSTPAQNAQTAMVNAGMVGIPLEKTITNNATQTNHTRLDYQSYTNTSSLLVPANSYQASYGQPLQGATQYLNYDGKGNILEYIPRSGIPTSFDWMYNQSYPTVKIENASNTLHDYTIPTISSATNYFFWAAGNFTQQTATLNVAAPGDIKLSPGWSGDPGGTLITYPYTLTGPVNESGYLCISSTGTGCGIYPSTITFTNMPVGTYTLSSVPTSNYSIGNDMAFTYPVIINTPASAGIKEFFYDGFEENPSAIKGTAHTGVKYLNGNDTISYIPPNNRNYLIQWWSLNGNWIFHQQTYTTNMVLQGPVDDVRIFPSDAKISTYTYTPLTGVTSEIDHNGKTIYYEYDGFQRLKNIKDNQGNIIKNYQYNYSGGCGPNCSVLTMQTFIATNTLSYPVGVFNVNGKLLGNAMNQSQYISVWMTDTANAHTGTIAAGDDSMHFKFTVNPGRIVPPSLTGCRYYQYDLAYNQLDAVRNINGCYVDFGDGISMRLGKTLGDTSVTIAPNTTLNYTYSPYNVSNEVYWIHTYTDSSEKTITLYHNDGKEYIELDNYFAPAPSLNRIRNLRGNIPQNMQRLSSSCFRDGSVLTVSGISNWSSVSSIRLYQIYLGDGISTGLHMNYAQDCLANDKNLEVIFTSSGLYTEGYEDTTFKISRFKTDWNSYFTKLDTITICDDHWNREDLSALKQLRSFAVYAGNQKHSLDPANNPLVPIPVSEIDNILNQISAGAGQFISNGRLIIGSGGTARSSLSDAAFNQLKSKGWAITINNVSY